MRYRQIGAFITWRARKQLLNLIFELGYENIKYFDTDSIYFFKNEFTTKKIKELQENKDIKIDDEELGAWKWEGQYENMWVLGAKKYRYKIVKRYIGNGKWEECDEWNYKIAGLANANSIFNKIGHQKFKPGLVLKNVSLKRRNLDSGAVLFETDYVLKKGDN